MRVALRSGMMGFGVELPPSFDLGDHQALAVPRDRATMLDVVVPEDRLAVVALWERVRESGIGSSAVHALSDPDRRLTLSVLDVRDWFGVWLAVLSDDEDQPDSLNECRMVEKQGQLYGKLRRRPGHLVSFTP